MSPEGRWGLPATLPFNTDTAGIREIILCLGTSYMSAGILFIGLGVLSGATCAFLIHRLMPLIKIASEISYNKKPKTYVSVLAVVLLLCSTIISALMKIFYVLWQGSRQDIWEDGAIQYQKLTSFTAQQFLIGAVIGYLVHYQLKLYFTDDLKERQLKLRRALNIPIYGLAGFALLSPYFDRLLPNATSVEISTIGKITFDARQSTQTQAGTFIAGPGGSSAIQVGANDLPSAIDTIMNISEGEVQNGKPTPDVCHGMMQRDKNYISIIDSINSSSSRNADQDRVALNNYESDLEFLKTLKPVEICLKAYSNRYLDYRLLLIDIKPFIQALSAMVNRPENINKASIVSGLMKNSIESLINQAQLYISLAGDENEVCDHAKQAIASANFAPTLANNALPYKTILLSYVLSAVGSSDRAILELATWIESNRAKAHPWHLMRAQIELAILLSNNLPDAERNPVYYNYVSHTFPAYQSLLGSPQLEKWSSECRTKSYYERLLMSSFTSAANAYVKSAANLDRISPAVIKISKNIRNVDFSCFSDIRGFKGEEMGWQAAILTSHASALLAASYSDRMFGKDEEADQKRYRQEARRDLVESIRLLNAYDQDQNNKSGVGTSPQVEPDCGESKIPTADADSALSSATKRAQEILARPRWGDVRSSAQSLLRKLVDGTE